MNPIDSTDLLDFNVTQMKPSFNKTLMSHLYLSSTTLISVMI